MSKLVSLLMRTLFYRSPFPQFSPEEIEQFESIYTDAVSKQAHIIYSSSYPKHRFIQYIASAKPVVLHGSNNKTIAEFEPRRQTLYNGQYADAVFATKDGIWPLFYAVLDRRKVEGNIRNACFHVRNDRNTFYFFSLTTATLRQDPWVSGMIYFLPERSFERVSHSAVSFDEWISTTSVTPITKIEVEPEDFLFLPKVS